MKNVKLAVFDTAVDVGLQREPASKVYLQQCLKKRIVWQSEFLYVKHISGVGC